MHMQGSVAYLFWNQKRFGQLSQLILKVQLEL